MSSFVQFARQPFYLVVFTAYSESAHRATTVLWESRNSITPLKRLVELLPQYQSVTFNPKELVVTGSVVSNAPFDTTELTEVMYTLGWTQTNPGQYRPLAPMFTWAGPGTKGPYDKVLISNVMFGPQTELVLNQLA